MVEIVFTPEIPNEWWQEAGMDHFKPQAKSYTSDSTHLVLMSEIQPLQRNAGVRYFEKIEWSPCSKVLLVAQLFHLLK